jgi:2-pyrone-4,6-dicarboxylate lactonase
MQNDAGETPNATPAAMRAPRLSCDCHVHIFGDPGIYPNRMPGHARELRTTRVEDLLALHRRVGIERAVFIQPLNYWTDHRCLLDAIATLPRARYRATAIIEDDVSDRTLRELDEAGFKGARFHYVPDEPNPSIEDLRRQLDRLKAIGWYAKFYFHPEFVPLLHEFFKTVDGLPIVIDHMGRFPARAIGSESYRLVCDLLARDNVWMMLSNGWRRSVERSGWSDMVAMGREFFRIAPDRCIWGTDWPHIGTGYVGPSPEQSLDLLYRYLPDEAARHAVLVANPARLHDFAP